MTGTKRIIKLILNLILPIIGIVALLYFGGKLIGLFMPFFIGWIISMIANPLVQFLGKRLKLVRKVGSVVVIVVVAAEAVAVATAAEQDQQDDDPPDVTAAEIVVAHKNTSKWNGLAG